MISLEIMGVLVFIINQEFSISWNHQEFFIDETVILWSMDAVACADATSELFFYLFIYLFLFYGFALTRLDSCQLGFYSRWFVPNRDFSAKIKLYQPNRVVSASYLNRPKLALNHARTTEIGFEWGPNILNLSFLTFILNICCFFCVFFFVLCFLPSSFFVLWIKT